MSEPLTTPISALNHARFEGIAAIEEGGLRGMITLRGDLSSKVLTSAARAASGSRIPKQRIAQVVRQGGICWMSPDELLILCPYDAVSERLASLNTALAGTHALAVNVSDARANFRVSGPYAREVLAKLCPVDLSPSAFRPGMFRRTRMAQVPVAFWMDADEVFHIICFRSVAEYVFSLLKASAAPASEVGVF